MASQLREWNQHQNLGGRGGQEKILRGKKVKKCMQSDV